MLDDLLSPNNYFYVNIKVAERFGLLAAAYISSILTLKSNSKYDKNGYFTLDRDFIRKRSTLQKSDQKEVEENLSALNIISIKEDKIRIDLNLLLNFFSDDDKELIKDVRVAMGVGKALSKRENKDNKNEFIKTNLKAGLNIQNDELRQAYCVWIDSIFQMNKGMNSATIRKAQQDIDQAVLCSDGHHDLNAALAILNIAAYRGYIDMKWAIENYYKNKSQSNVHSNIGEVPLDLASEVF